MRQIAEYRSSTISKEPRLVKTVTAGQGASTVVTELYERGGSYYVRCNNGCLRGIDLKFEHPAILEAIKAGE